MRYTPFGQVITAMITPFDAGGKLDEAGVKQIVEHLLQNGSDGIVVCGTTGESPALSHEEKLTMFQLVKEASANRCSVIAGTGSADTAASVQLTREAADIGVDGALLVVPPYNRPSQEGLYQHFCTIAASVPKLPCMLYNVPARTARNLEAATALRLAHDVENIVAVKEASGDLMQCSAIAAGAGSRFALYSGEDGLTLPMLSVGGCGVVSVTSHLVGKHLKAMHTAFFAGDQEEAAALHYRMLPIVRACFQPSTSSPAPLKAAMAMLGLAAGPLRLPLVEANENEKNIVRTALAQAGLL